MTQEEAWDMYNRRRYYEQQFMGMGPGSYYPPYIQAPQPPPPLPCPGVETQLLPNGDFLIRLTTSISADELAATQEKGMLIEVALAKRIRDAAQEILGKLALERIRVTSGLEAKEEKA